MTQRYRRARDVLWRHSFGQLIVRPRRGQSVVVDGAGAALWDALAEPGTIDEIASRLARTFDAPVDVVARDVQPVLDVLLEHDVAEVVP